MKLKLDDKGQVVVQNGLAVWIDDDGSEVAFDVPGARKSIATLKTEAKDNRLKLEEATTKLSTFEGIDPAKAKSALETVSNLDSKKLMDTQGVEKLKADITAGFQTQLTERDKKISDLTGSLVNEKIGGSFARSKFITDKGHVPSDVFQALFQNRFKLEGDKVIAHYPDGSPIRSKANPAVEADFEEALGVMVESYPGKASLLKSDQKGGSGAPSGGGSGGGAGGKTIPRSQFDALPLSEQATQARGGVQITDG